MIDQQDPVYSCLEKEHNLQCLILHVHESLGNCQNFKKFLQSTEEKALSFSLGNFSISLKPFCMSGSKIPNAAELPISLYMTKHHFDHSEILQIQSNLQLCRAASAFTMFLPTCQLHRLWTLHQYTHRKRSKVCNAQMRISIVHQI